MLTLLPLPYVDGTERRDGLNHPWPERCRTCPTRECEKQGKSGVGLCSYGYNFIRISKDLLLAGFVVEDYANSSQARTKAMARARRDRLCVTSRVLEDLQRRLTGTVEAERAEVKARCDAAVNEYIQQQMYKNGVLEVMRPELRRAFSYLHDYRQFISTVTQNINVILETNYKGSLDAKLESASRAEVAIYWAAKLMEEKLKSASFLLEPEKIDDVLTYTNFEFYKMVDKYIHVYRSSFDFKKVKIAKSGECYGSVRGNSEAIAIIPHTFIDNALKYSPKGTIVTVQFVEDEEDIELKVASYGPVIHPSEEETIFKPFQRGREAEALAPGMGFGLYLARFVARKMDTDISVRQDKSRRSGTCCWTEFSVVFRKA